VSRPIAIIHLKNGEEIMWEIPCRDLWRAGKNILLNKNHPEIKGINVSPSSLLSCLHDCSICVPSYRCVGIIAMDEREKHTIMHQEEVEETSRCSISSALSFASTTIVASSSKNRGREDGLKRMNQSLRSKMKSFSLNKISLKTSSKNLTKKIKKKDDELEDDFVSRMPEWFVKAAKEYCGDDVFNSSNVYKTPR
jgi:hypothetical protein